MKPINPYIVGNPIREQAGFFGRQDIFREVLQVLRQRGSNAIVLYGQRRIGKTSVLLQLEQQLRHSGEFTPVYFDLQDKAAKSLPEVLYELSQHISKVTGHAVAKASDFDRTGDYFRNVFLPEIAEKVAKGGLVLLFDEFDVLDSPTRTQAAEAFFPYLREWMTDVQKVKFVFVIGRRPEDLSVRTMSTFKGIQSTRVSFLSKPDAEAVIHQSEREGSLKWEDAVADKVLELTHGHPYFTQLLCSVIWENTHESGPEKVPTVSVEDVEKAILPALKFGANAFNWLWDGLPPAERVVVAAMAEIPEEIITQERLIETLNQSGVRLVARELEFAPETLIDWEVLIESDGAFRFAVPLLRRWVLVNRPLRRVKEELDRLDPLAETLFQAGQGFYNSNNPQAAEQQLRQALNINPNHLKARLLLGQVLLEKGDLTESVDMFDAAYQYDERAARGNLIKSLLALAETQDETLQLSTYERILKIQSDQSSATEKIRAIWVRRGETALTQGNFEEALRAFEQINDQERIATVRSAMHEKKLALDMQRAEIYEKRGQWKPALDALLELTSEYPDSEPLRARVAIARTHWQEDCLRQLKKADAGENWEKVLEICDGLEKDFPDLLGIKEHAERARTQLGLTQKYHEALGAMQTGQADQARQMLTDVLRENPKHLQAAQKLIEATYGQVKILVPVPVWVHFLAFVSVTAWTISVIFAASGWVADRIAGNLMTVYGGDRYFYYETFILVGVILAPLVDLLLSFYITQVFDNAFQVKQEKPSYIKALWIHLVLGMGLFYVDRKTQRKQLYPVLAGLTSLLVFAFIFYKVTAAITIGNFYLKAKAEGLFENAIESMLWFVLIFYALSFIDVLLSCYLVRQNYRSDRVDWRSMVLKSIRPDFQQRQLRPESNAESVGGSVTKAESAVQKPSSQKYLQVSLIIGWSWLILVVIVARFYPVLLGPIIILGVLFVFIVAGLVSYESRSSKPPETADLTQDTQSDKVSKM
jgi:tetratricopeptide (TPR) repeat protein